MVSAVYIHIPFCNEICSYCDFCKFYYNENIVDEYLNCLKEEILSNYKNEIITTIYIGGGTPTSLNVNQLEKLLSYIYLFNISEDCEITIETNVDLSTEKILLLKKYGVNRVSVGVQTINKKCLDILNRKHSKDDVIKIVKNLKEVDICNINLDLIYAIPGQNMDDLKVDLEFFTSLGINHISTYSLIIEDNTILKIKGFENISEDDDFKMYEYVKNYLESISFINYEFSNYGLNGYFSKHNLVYWNNLEYYGFGAGASGYLNGFRYDNTKNLSKYLRNDIIESKTFIDFKTNMENEMILGLRKLSGVSCSDFFKKYGFKIEDVFDIKELLGNKLVIENDFLKIHSDYLYRSNEILIHFVDNFLEFVD